LLFVLGQSTSLADWFWLKLFSETALSLFNG
jgi:hypothetical protein